MTIVVAVRRSGAVAIASNRGSGLGSKQLNPPNFARRQLVMCGDVVIGNTGWGNYPLLMEAFVERAKPSPPHTERAVLMFVRDMLSFLMNEKLVVDDQPGSDESPFPQLDSELMFATPRAIFHVTAHMSVIQMTRFSAIGSGADFALGALHALYDRMDDPAGLAIAAARAAETFDDDCNGGIEVMTVGGRRRTLKARAT
jgi:ATP-dependent protease HslVU (ClpYQ) peptidase subunit